MFSHLLHLLRSRTRHRRGRRSQVELITDARQSPLENWQYRRTMYNEVSQVLFRLSRWENLEYAKKI